MVFSSLQFMFLFLPLFLFIYFLCPTRNLKNITLFIFSIGFYAWGEPVYVFFILFSMMVNYLSALGIHKTKGTVKKAIMILNVAFNVGVILYFKYMDFFITNINSVTGTELPLLHIALPIGISFFTFQILSYTIDVYWGDIRVQKNPIYLGAYIFGFPQLIAGPIVRYQTIEEELENRRENLKDFSIGVRRFILGVCKKVLIANNVGFVADTIFMHSPQDYGAIGAWTGVIAYTLQIYYDFSGYSDMAIGLGKMLGFNYLENFNYPYIATSITDFWRRWHISLSSFFRDYVYIPLGGNRTSKLKWLRNILVVWMLTGFWHGAQWNYILWGLYYGVLLVLEKVLSSLVKIRVPGFIRHMYALIFILIGWVIFRMEDVTLIPKVIHAMFGGDGTGDLSFLAFVQVLDVKYIIALLAGIIFSIPIIKLAYDKISNRMVLYAFDLVLTVSFIISIMFLVSGSYNPFIYFKF